MRKIVLAMVLLSGASAVTAQGPASSETTVRAIFKPYLTKGAPDAPSAWERKVYSKRFATIIQKWQAATRDEDMPEFADADWYCQCQDYDAATAKLARLIVKPLGKGRQQVTTHFSAGWNEKPSPLRLIMINEGGRWRVDELYFEDDTRGLSKQLPQKRK